MKNTFEAQEYTPQPGDLCKVYRALDNIFPVCASVDSMISYCLEDGDIILITSVQYQIEQSCFYVEFIFEGKIYCAHFFEQVFAFDYDKETDCVKKAEANLTTYNFPWVVCD
mgnify:CR=1 FL=1|tara:strand:+ start:25 stop:360 length:336 start_codon:yes stop_codon:yes gene_type:complete